VAAHATHHHLDDDRTQFGERARTLSRTAWVVAAVGLIASVALGFFADADRTFHRFLYAYLAAYGFFLSLGLGGLFFVLTQHLTRAGWSVTVRRVPEALGATMPALAALSLPIILSVAIQNGALYRWALPMSAAEKHEANLVETHATAAPSEQVNTPSPAEADAKAVTHSEESKELDAGAAFEGKPGVLDEEVLVKRAYLNPTFFIVRMVVYFAVWCFAGVWFRRQSVLQDSDGDPARTARMQSLSAVVAIFTFLALTFAAFDLLMSLDPLWFSTIFGVYFFAGCTIAVFAFMAIAYHWLQAEGYLKESVNVDHYQDIGKFLFGFVFFWGYIAFSQYMLLWYSNIPEETAWWRRHGGTTVSADITVWSFVIVAILFGKLLIPFGGLLSRHVKRNKAALIFWSVWLLAFQALDIFWIVMPQLGKSFNVMTLVMYFTCAAGIGGAMFAVFARALGSASLRPLRDPRMDEALAYSN
jgi:hypothetical protein